MTNEKPRVMPLAQAICYLEAHHTQVILHYDAERGVDIWTPALKKGVPIALRRSIVKNKSTLKAMMDSGAAEVCTNRALHRRSWQYQGNGRFACELCRHFVAAGIC